MLYESYYGIADLSSGQLYHHGIKGQKWGVRRFQNPDGSLTAAGKQRYYTSSGKQTYGASKAANDPNNMDHSKSSVSRQVARLGINVALSVIQLNPFAAANAMGQIGGVISSSVKTDRVNRALAKNKKVDEETGLKLKQKEMSPEKDMARVNPGFKNFNENTKNNCMLCTMTYEMRRRGYDVTANKASYGYDSRTNERWFPGAKTKTVAYETTPTERLTHKNLIANTTKELLSQGDGARGNIMVVWDKTLSGHSMHYEVSGGKVTIRCPQSNTTYRNPSKILRRCRSVSYTRLDNLDFDKDKIKEVCHS